MKQEEIKTVVRKRYGQIAKSENSCCGSVSTLSRPDVQKYISKSVGYTEKELGEVPDGANLGLGCGNPVALASLKKGEVVLDLGSGAGFDCFLAANRVGSKGKVIGIDMTGEMIEKAKDNAVKGHFKNVEFRLAEIENLPVTSNSIDVIISNCVINLSPDKKRVFQEAYRVLKPGGRLMVSDVILLKELPDSIKHSIEAYVGCVGGAMKKEEYISSIKSAGFKSIEIVSETKFSPDLFACSPDIPEIAEFLKTMPEMGKNIADSIASIRISAVKL